MSAHTPRTVWAIPLASKGFVPTDPETNPVFWYLEDYETGKVVDTKPHATKADAEAKAYARTLMIPKAAIKVAS